MAELYGADGSRAPEYIPIAQNIKDVSAFGDWILMEEHEIEYESDTIEVPFKAVLGKVAVAGPKTRVSPGDIIMFKDRDGRMPVALIMIGKKQYIGIPDEYLFVRVNA